MDIGEIEAEIESEAVPVQQRGQRDLTVGPVVKTLWLFIMPTLGANVLQRSTRRSAAFI
jgi:hypothetical protein